VVPREITARGKAAMGFATASVGAAAVAIMATLLVLLQRIVVTPLSRLTRHAIALGQSDDLSARFGGDRKDEVGILGRAFDAMVEKLAEARRKLLEQSYRSGVAEMAAGVLHNVRNALTPVLVEVDELRQELARTPLDQIETARQELSRDSVDESRRDDLSRFLDLANGRLVSVARETNIKLESVVGRARQIEQFLTDQEGSSRSDRPAEKVVLSDVVEEAVNLLSGELRGCMSVRVDAELSSLGPVQTHRVGLLQILANLLTNAAESVQRSAKGRGTVEITAGIEAPDGKEMVHVRVKDDGDGILAENLERVFERGFTTKQGSSGLGLHWCANTVASMGGRIHAESEGKGRGACLHLLIPRSL
jgi:two-component system, NtrC family, sensor kinase